MSEVPVYVIANLQVEDAAAYREYEIGFFPILNRYGGTFLTFDDAPHTFEGIAPREGRMVIFSFPSAAQAQAWYEDQEYQALSEHRRGSTKLQFLTMVRGMAPRA